MQRKEKLTLNVRYVDGPFCAVAPEPPAQLLDYGAGKGDSLYARLFNARQFSSLNVGNEAAVIHMKKVFWHRRLSPFQKRTLQTEVLFPARRVKTWEKAHNYICNGRCLTFDITYQNRQLIW